MHYTESEILEQTISCKIDANGRFEEFTYSKRSHMEYFIGNKYDEELYGYSIDPDDCSLKVYQDLLVFAFIKENIPPGSKLLDIGGGYSRVLKYYKGNYECWNIDKLEGLGNGLSEKKMEGVKLVVDYMGNFNKELPDNYFDFVFSISAFENIPENNQKVFFNILEDINRVTKVNGLVFHCFDVVVKDEYIWTNKLLLFFFQNSNTLNEFVHFDILKRAKDLYVMSEKYYETNWRSSTNRSYEDFGKPLSYNIVWRKERVENAIINKLKKEIATKRLSINTLTKPSDFIKKHPAYVFHHIIKCGGTSVQRQLSKWFQIESDYRSYLFPNKYLLLDNVNLYNKYKINTEIFTSDVCLVSHFDTEGTYIHQRYPEIIINKEKFRIFAFVRDPMSLYVSLYYYKYRDKELLSKYKLKNFLNNFYHLLSNQFPCNESNYKDVLNRYFFIGIVEKMQESFDKFADMAGKKRIKLHFENKSEKDSQIEELKNDVRFIDEFKKRNKLDYLIYDYCLEKFSKY